MDEIKLKKHKDLRIGQSIFNFLEWLRLTKRFDVSQSKRMADPFHIPDEEFVNWWNEYHESLQDETK